MEPGHKTIDSSYTAYSSSSYAFNPVLIKVDCPIEDKSHTYLDTHVFLHKYTIQVKQAWVVCHSVSNYHTIIHLKMYPLIEIWLSHGSAVNQV